ncbi:MAG TPA: STAS domain-containing protein [Solirubrobacteraceae bacterium]|nr:STAS domain-containing protein [Solirubrobacteraceae bacterium]
MDEGETRRTAPEIDARGLRPPASFAIAERPAASGIAVLALEGELDLSAAPKLRARIEEAAAGRALVIGLRRVTFVDSAILKELLRARAQLAERDIRLVLAEAPMPVRRLLDLTRTSELFEQAPDVDTALTRLTA